MTKKTKTILSPPQTILAFDQASIISGFAIRVPDSSPPQYLPHSTGTIKGVGSPEAALKLDSIISKAIELGRPVQAVMEQHPPFGRAKTIAALARAQGAIQQAFGARSIIGKAIVSVPPATWRKAVLALPGWCPREQAKAEAIAYANRFGVGLTITEDSSEALCLAFWGALQHGR